MSQDNIPSKERFQRRVLACDKIQFTQMENGDIEVYFYGDPEPHSVARVEADERKELIEWLRPSDETLPVATPEISIDIAHSQALSAFADRYNGEGPSLPSEDRWVSGYMHALLDIGRGKATAQKACEHCGERHAAGPCKDAIVP